MKMLRHYFISDSLDDLEVFEEQLEAAGVSTPQIHVLSRNDAEVHQHPHLHDAPESLAAPLVQIGQCINSNQKSMVQYMPQAASSIRVRQKGDPGYLGKRLKSVNLLDEESVPEYARDFA